MSTNEQVDNKQEQEIQELLTYYSSLELTIKMLTEYKKQLSDLIMQKKVETYKNIDDLM